MNDNASIKGSIFNLKSKSMEFKSFTPRITDYELLEGIGKQKIWQFMKKPRNIGGVDDVSYLYLAKYKHSQELIGLKYTDLSLSPDYEFIEELTVRKIR